MHVWVVCTMISIHSTMWKTIHNCATETVNIFWPLEYQPLHSCVNGTNYPGSRVNCSSPSPTLIIHQFSSISMVYFYHCYHKFSIVPSRSVFWLSFRDTMLNLQQNKIRLKSLQVSLQYIHMPTARDLDVETTDIRYENIMKINIYWYYSINLDIT